jgi:hypothetical protein
LISVYSIQEGPFTGPYFHNGGRLTLSSGRFSRAEAASSPPAASAQTPHPLNLSPADRGSLVAFLKALE